MPAHLPTPDAASGPSLGHDAADVSRWIGVLVDGRFEVESLAGRGGMGEVFSARDQVSGGLVALKVMHRHLDEASAARFADEASTLGELAHPGIVGLVTAGHCSANRCTYLAMEWLQGEDLASLLLRNGPPPVADAVALLKRITVPLAYAHAQGLVHRDIKPANVFMTGDDHNTVKLLDFGIARFEHGRSQTQTGVAVGTPYYMAPEQARGLPTVDARADVYALGALFFELLTGRPPFVGDHGLAVLMMALFEEAPTINELRRGEQRVAPALNELVRRMLAKDPVERPVDARAVAAELDALGALQGAPALPSGASPFSREASSLTADELRIVSVVAAAGPGLAETSRNIAVVSVVDRDPADTAAAGVVAVVPDLPAADVAVANVAGDVADATGAALMEELRSTVANYGARLEQLADGTLVAMVVGAGLPTEQAVSAARCALAMRQVRPDVPMVVATGRSRSAGLGQPVGEVIERAVAALFRTAAGSIQVDDMTAGLLPERFEVHSDGERMALLDEKDPVADVRTLLGRPTPCVGRRRELRHLEAIFDDCAEDAAAAAVLVQGPPGIGKTRLCVEFIRRLRERSDESDDAFHLIYGRAESFGGSSPYGLVGDAIRRFVGIHPRDNLAVRRHKLQTRIGRHLTDANRRRVALFLGEAFGVPFPATDDLEMAAARRDGRLMADQVRQAFVTWLRSEAFARPMVAFLEDLQWADRPSLALIDAALGLRDMPLLVVAASRVDAGSGRETLWNGRDVTRIPLGRLRDKAAASLIDEVLGETVTPQETAVLVAQADGNAFFLEELIRARTSPQGSAGPGSLPDTVLGMIEARLAGLASSARLVLRAASVFGDTFAKDAVLALCGTRLSEGELGRELAGLADAELLTPYGGDSRDHSGSFRFRNAVLREAAYAMLTERDKSLGHKLAGEWLSRTNDPDELSKALHFMRGGDPGRARPHYARAAKTALDANDFEGAYAHADAAIEGGATGSELGVLQLIQSEAMLFSGDMPTCAEHARSVVSSCEPGTATWFRAIGYATFACSLSGEEAELAQWAERLYEVQASEPEVALPQVIALLQVAVALSQRGQYHDADALVLLAEKRAERVPDHDRPVLVGRLAGMRGQMALSDGDLGAAVRHYRASTEAYTRCGNHRRACNMRISLGFGDMRLGRLAVARRELEEAAARSEQMGLRHVAAVAKHNLGLALALSGQLEEGLVLEQQAYVTLLDEGDVRVAGTSLVYVAQIQQMRGDLGAAEKAANEAVAILDAFEPSKALALAILGGVILAAGRPEEALGHAERAWEMFGDLGSLEEGEVHIALTYGKVLRALGRKAEAMDVLESALKRLTEQSLRIGDEEIRGEFLQGVAEHRELRALTGA